MSSIAENLKSTLLELSTEDRADLAAFLLHSLGAQSEVDFDEYWIRELSRRDAEIEAGAPAEKVFAD